MRNQREKKMVEVRDLEVGWSPDDILLKGVSFDIFRGEVVTILGGSGCGKSTLLRHLIGLERPLSGTITIEGKLVEHHRVGRPTFGVMFQAGALFGSMNVVENVALPMREWAKIPEEVAHAMARAKLRLVGLEGAAEKLPSELSGGMKKRAAIARAMALEPALLFLDEPSAGLDPITSAELDELILSLKKVVGITVVMVTHELDSIFAIADRCVMLDKEAKGVIAIGSPKELSNSEDDRVRNFFKRTPRAA